MKKMLFLPAMAASLVVSGCFSVDVSCPENMDCCMEMAGEPVVAECAVARNAAPAPRMMMGKSANHFQAPQGQMMAFNTQLTLEVTDIREAIAQTREITTKNGGYVKRIDNRSSRLAIPVGKADGVLKEISAIGVVQSLSIQADDVTKQVMDLGVRLNNLEKSRARLLALMDKSGKVEDLLKVEKELTRITTELETCQTQQKNLKNRVDYVDFYVSFSAARIAPVRKTQAPVVWVNRLGSDLLNNMSVCGGVPQRGITLPAGFVQASGHAAISGNNCTIVFSDYKNPCAKRNFFCNDYAGVEFYEGMIEKALNERFNVSVTKKETTADGNKALEFTVQPVIGKIPYTYRVLVCCDGDTVYVLEAFGKTADLKTALPENAWTDLVQSLDF